MDPGKNGNTLTLRVTSWFLQSCGPAVLQSCGRALSAEASAKAGGPAVLRSCFVNHSFSEGWRI
jgi:hypothetical protein